MEWCVGSRTLLRTPDRLPCEGCQLRVPVTLEVCRSLACSACTLVNDPGIARDEIPGGSVGVDAFSFGARARREKLKDVPHNGQVSRPIVVQMGRRTGCVGALAFAAGIAAARGGWRSVAGASSETSRVERHAADGLFGLRSHECSNSLPVAADEITRCRCSSSRTTNRTS